jgi:hypothetical protein
MKYGRHAKAEAVLAKVVARGGDGQDWLALGVAQLAQDKHDKAEGTLKGAQNLMKDNPYPAPPPREARSHAKKDPQAEREADGARHPDPARQRRRLGLPLQLHQGDRDGEDKAASHDRGARRTRR